MGTDARLQLIRTRPAAKMPSVPSPGRAWWPRWWTSAVRLAGGLGCLLVLLICTATSLALPCTRHQGGVQRTVNCLVRSTLPRPLINQLQPLGARSSYCITEPTCASRDPAAAGDCYDYDIAMAIPAWQNLTGEVLPLRSAGAAQFTGLPLQHQIGTLCT